MSAKAIVPSKLQEYYDDWRMSPGLEVDGFIFLTGFTGADPDGRMSQVPEEQMRFAFEKIGAVLKEAKLDFGAIVEMTTYHVGLRDHLEIFKQIRAEHVQEPYPAWTAIEVAGFVHEEAIIEIRVIARRKG